MRRKYGDVVRVEYLDFANQQTREQYAAVVEEIESKDLMFPVIAVDDDFIAEGIVDYWTIATALEERLNREQQNKEV
ncbi:MAG: DUF1462 family protein [Chloroflexi bacterium]|nr:DUF1462 family protein [Chloroflexota bacterium]